MYVRFCSVSNMIKSCYMLYDDVRSYFSYDFLPVFKMTYTTPKILVLGMGILKTGRQSTWKIYKEKSSIKQHSSYLCFFRCVCRYCTTKTEQAFIWESTWDGLWLGGTITSGLHIALSRSLQLTSLDRCSITSFLIEPSMSNRCQFHQPLPSWATSDCLTLL